ncbi:MAG: fused MFS/spermidine synthase [Myxococcales bacterium]|nr:fused MFS/spermidine synthase [Myxococcales bacterium]
MQRIRLASLYVALFLSGSAALVYQTTWGRMLQRVFGVSDLAIATVLGTFFLGLGLGSALGGRYASRTQRPALVYGVLEVLIGLWALLSLLLIPNLHALYGSIGAGLGFGALTALRFALAMVILLPPTLLMGATLPILIRAATRHGLHWSSSATWLYATNTLGAVAGAGLTGLYLVPTFGTRASVIIAALASFGAAVVILAFWSRRPAEAPAPTEAPAPAPELQATATPEAAAPPSADRLPNAARLAMVLAAVAGFASLASEVLWTRVLRMVVQGTTQAFAAMLVNFLLGIAIGSLVAERLMSKGRDPRTLFGVTQLMLALLSAFAMLVGAQMPRLSMLLQERYQVVPHEAWVVLVMSAVLLLPLALVLGTSVPLAWRIAGGSAEEAAKHSGRVLATNTLGGLVGSLLAGFLLVPLLGIEAAIFVVIFVHLIASAIAFRSVVRGLVPKVLAITAPLMVGAALLSAQPSLHVPYLLDAWYDTGRALINGPSEDYRQNVKFLEEGRNTTVTILERGGSLRLFNDGRPESGISLTGEPGFGEELALLGSLSTLFAEEHGRAMVVGLGAGHSAAVMTGGPWEQIDVVELEESVVRAARILYEAREKPFPVDDERVRLIVDDARAQLVLAPEDSYDAVVSQPSHPWLAGSSALYTREFFEEVDRALRPGGVLALWTNLFRIHVRHLRSIVATLHEVFENVQAFVTESSSFVLVAGHGPLALDARFGERVSSEGLQPFLRPFALDDHVDFVATLELDVEASRIFSEGAPIVRDDRPTLEIELARIPHDQSLNEAALDHALRSIPWISAAALQQVPTDLRVEVFLRRIEHARLRLPALERVEASLDGSGLPPLELDLVRGALAEARGDVGAALRAFDRARADTRAADRADRLRHAEGHFADLFASLDTPDRARPLRAEPFLEAALALRDRQRAAQAVALAESIGDTVHPAALGVAGAYAAADCAALLEAATEAALDTAPVGELAAECALALGRPAEAFRLMERRGLTLRGIAARETREAETAKNGHNGGLAMMHYRRAVRANPGHAAAAGELARILHGLGRTEEAAEILRNAWAEAKHLPAARSIIEGAASAQMVALP